MGSTQPTAFEGPIATIPVAPSALKPQFAAPGATSESSSLPTQSEWTHQSLCLTISHPIAVSLGSC